MLINFSVNNILAASFLIPHFIKKFGHLNWGEGYDDLLFKFIFKSRRNIETVKIVNIVVTYCKYGAIKNHIEINAPRHISQFPGGPVFYMHLYVVLKQILQVACLSVFCLFGPGV